jgi:undecaprenyl-diphosphatase
LNIIHASILGILQGILEWLPVSSEGILTLVSINLLGIQASEAIKFSIWLHLGTFLAALIYFRKDILKLVKHFPGYLKNVKSDDENSKLITFLIISTILTGLIGLPLFLFAVDILGVLSAKIMTFIIGFFLIITGLLQKKSKDGTKKTEGLQNKDGIIIGILQGFSALPGISRSGITTSGLLFKKFDSETALKLSFMMSIPTIFVAEIGLGIIKGFEFSLASFVSVLFSFIFGIISIGLLLKIAKKIKFWKFCLVLGLISILSILL